MAIVFQILLSFSPHFNQIELFLVKNPVGLAITSLNGSVHRRKVLLVRGLASK